MKKDKFNTSGLNISLRIEYLGIEDIIIESFADRYGQMSLWLEVSSDINNSKIMSLVNTHIKVISPDEKVLFSGICDDVVLEENVEYKRIRIEAFSKNVITDKERKVRTFQSPEKHLSDIIREVLNTYNGTFKIDKDVLIETVVYQQNETDWEFLKRIANKYGLNMFSDISSDFVFISFGRQGINLYKENVLGIEEGCSFDIEELRFVQQNLDSMARAYQFEKNNYLCNETNIHAGDVVGRFIVIESFLENEGGLLSNHIIIQRKNEAKPLYENSIIQDANNYVLTGEVINVDGNNINVQFDTDTEDMKGNSVEIPYESVISNSFYCMPDEGDRVYVYYENNGKIVCVGSKWKDASHGDFNNSNDKSLTCQDKMIKFTSSSLKFTDTRKKHDQEDETEISIILDDADGITITSGSDVIIESNAGTSINMVAASYIPDLEEAETLLKSGQEKFKNEFKAGYEKYVADGGLSFLDQFGEVVLTEFSRYWRDLKKNFDDTFGMHNLADLVNGKYMVEDENKKIRPCEKEKEPEQYETGVVTIYGLNSVTLKVSDSVIVLDSDI